MIFIIMMIMISLRSSISTIIIVMQLEQSLVIM